MNPGQHSDLKTVLVQHGPLDPARAVDVVRQIAAAIDGSPGTSAREVTTSTIALAHDGTAFLTAGTASGATPSQDRTRILVTDSEATHRAAIAALAAVLNECLTGHPPDPAARPSQQRPGLPSAFDDVIIRGLATHPDVRFGSAAELAAAAQHALPMAPRTTPSSQPTVVGAPLPTRAEAPNEVTQTIQIPSAPTTPDQPAVQHRSPTVSYPHSHPRQLPAPPLRPRRGRKGGLLGPIIAAIVVVAAVVAGAITIPRLVHHSAPSAATGPSSPPRTYTSAPVELPFPGLDRPRNVAVDGSGNIYVLSSVLETPDPDPFESGRPKLFKLAPGTNSVTTVDFRGVDFRMANDVTVDAAGNVYLCDGKQVWELSPGAPDPIRLPFQGFVSIAAIAIDAAGNAYAVGNVATGNIHEVRYGAKKLIPGDNRPTDLSFTDLYLPHGITVDKDGNVYVSAGVKGRGKGHVLKLAAGATTTTELPLPDVIEPQHMAVDALGNVFVADGFGKGLFELRAGASTATLIPLGRRTSGVAVDSTGTLFITVPVSRDQSDHVIKNAQVLKLAPDK
ncbi:hypothetical protein A5634_24030 [Mycobacterium asiaticum]|uniref:SMP-30/Gluconolactonase/LRE-like region domain-containing protein n=1 Tax=Mycobacterium asiaticum TaxID=1790 RepID=A0A1A3NYJ9_MYCAS|nr:hypothetical protein [Mycobacterium asiaticum]OBK27016.1 hypothetical protein A5634_24030 [Mycobacterium asiaticum]